LPPRASSTGLCVTAGADTSSANMLSRTMADLDLFVGNTPQPC
jgi:hypothetical protein